MEVTPRQTSEVCAFLLAALWIGTSSPAQDPVQQLRQRIEQLQADTDEAIEELENRLAQTQVAADAARSGTNNFLVTGYAFAGFENHENEDSSFNAGFNPIFLWKHSDNLFFEGELEFELEGDETEVALEYAQINLVLSDHLVIGAGKFLNPVNYFQERLHPLWINKLPDKPLPFDGPNRLQAPSHLGVQARGAFRFENDMRLEYAAYLANSSALRIDDSGGDEPGTLNHRNWEDNNNNKGFGARVGFFPIPELEVGYGLEWAKVSPSGFTDDVDALIHAIDLNYVAQSDVLMGTVEARFQAVFSNIDDTTYMTTGGPLSYDNEREGYYAQVAYRPTQVENEIIANLEGVVRIDLVDQPSGALTPVDQTRVTLGLNYWFEPSTVLKVAYVIDDKDDPTGAAVDEDVFMLQVAMGF